VKKDDGSRAIGTILDPKGSNRVHQQERAFYGEATILGKPISRAMSRCAMRQNNVIGILYVGYMKDSAGVRPGGVGCKPGEYLGLPIAQAKLEASVRYRVSTTSALAHRSRAPP